jgi:hypothetical protein
MSFPREIAAAVEQTGARLNGARFAIEVECEGARFHSPQPLVVREVQIRKGYKVMLCGTCADNLTTLKTLIASYDGELPWPVRREFGNQIRALLKDGKNG